MRYLEHMLFGPIGFWPGGVHTAHVHLRGELYPCTAETIELMHELGERVEATLEQEYLGFGPLFDLSYEQYLEGERP